VEFNLESGRLKQTLQVGLGDDLVTGRVDCVEADQVLKETDR
jgi:hypothetical protein